MKESKDYQQTRQKVQELRVKLYDCTDQDEIKKLRSELMELEAFLQTLKNEHILEDNRPKVLSRKLKPGQRRLRVQFDMTYGGTEGAVIEGESVTEPDLSLSIGQLLERHTRGQDVPGNVNIQEPIYLEMKMPTFNDLTDIERYKENLEGQLHEITTVIEQEKAAAQAKAKKAKAKKDEKEQKTESRAKGKQLTIEDDDAKA